MLSQALPMRELHRQELLAEAASARRLEQLCPDIASEPHGRWRGIRDARQGIAMTLASLRPAVHLPSQAPAQ